MNSGYSKELNVQKVSYPNHCIQKINPPRSVRFNVVFSFPNDNFVQLEKGSPQYHTLYPVSMSYVIGGGVQLIDNHLMETLQVEFSCGGSVNKNDKFTVATNP